VIHVKPILLRYYRVTILNIHVWKKLLPIVKMVYMEDQWLVEFAILAIISKILDVSNVMLNACNVRVIVIVSLVYLVMFC
jgi:hypothetical protein